ncbi:MAG: hypothetical protein H7301_12025 [Cryobacterium sp.]|nr:hypothetical protein [Oligoflexia bacterium]
MSMRRVDEVHAVLTPTFEYSDDVLLDDIEDLDMGTSASSEFPQHLDENNAELLPSKQVGMKARAESESSDNVHRVVPMTRKLYSQSEIKKAIALEELHLQSILNRTAHPASHH